MLWRPLRTNPDRNTGWGPPERNRQRADLGALEAMAVQGAQVAMAVQGAQEAMAELGALEAMAELGALEAMADGLWGPWPRSLGPAPTAGTPFTPPQNFLGKSGGIRSPPGLDTQNSTGQPSRAKQTGQDSPQEPLPPPRQGGRRLEWPPWPQQEEPPAPDESPWTRHDKTRFFKMFLWAQQDLKTALLAVTGGTRSTWHRESGGQRA